MSGGSFDYLFARIDDYADCLQDKELQELAHDFAKARICGIRLFKLLSSMGEKGSLIIIQSVPLLPSFSLSALYPPPARPRGPLRPCIPHG